MKNRTIIGIICIVLALVVTFAVAPLVNKLTLLANSAQIKLLVEYENSGKIHADLVYRGDAETAQRFLDAQDEYFKNLPEPDSEDGDTEETDEDDGRKR